MSEFSKGRHIPGGVEVMVEGKMKILSEKEFAEARQKHLEKARKAKEAKARAKGTGVKQTQVKEPNEA